METGLWCKDNSEARMEQRREGDGKLRLDRRAARLTRWWPAATGSGHEWHDCRGRSQGFFVCTVQGMTEKGGREKREVRMVGGGAKGVRGQCGEAKSRDRGGCAQRSTNPLRGGAQHPAGSAGSSAAPASGALHVRAAKCKAIRLRGLIDDGGQRLFCNGTAGPRMGVDMAARRGRNGGGDG